MGVTGELARFIASTRHSDIPDIVIAEAKMCLLDWLSVSLAGTNDPMVESVIQTVELLGGAPQQLRHASGPMDRDLRSAGQTVSAARAADFHQFLVFPGDPINQGEFF